MNNINNNNNKNINNNNNKNNKIILILKIKNKGLKHTKVLACAHSNVATDNLLKGFFIEKYF
jgi:hypothetical protein